MGLVDPPGVRQVFRLKPGIGGKDHFSDYSIACLSLFSNFLWDPKEDYRRPIKRTNLWEPCKNRSRASTNSGPNSTKPT